MTDKTDPTAKAYTIVQSIEKLIHEYDYDEAANIIDAALSAEYQRGLLDAAKIVEGEVLLSPDEFEGKVKLKIFDLLERIAVQIFAKARGLK